MATYPTFSQSVDSTFDWLDDIQIDRASNGTVKARALFTAPKAIGNILHRLTNTERATLDAFYLANRRIPFDFVWSGDGLTYSCLFSGPPKYKSLPGLYWDTTVGMVQT